MPRRVSLPAADELFRTTGGSAVQSSAPAQQHSNGEEPAGSPAEAAAARVPAPAAGQDAQAGDGTGDDAAADADGRGHDEHSAAEEGEEPAAGEPSGGTAGGREHSGAERGGQDRHPGGQRHMVPSQGPAPAVARARGGQDAPEPPRVAAQAQPGRGEPKSRQTAAPSPRRGGGRGANRRPSGRERHDEKITVYVSAEELMDLEHARLVLRGEHGLAVDRGRIVREAVAVVLADLESRGEASILVRRLRGR